MAVWVTNPDLLVPVWHNDPDHITTTLSLNSEVVNWLDTHVCKNMWSSNCACVNTWTQDSVIITFKTLDHETLFNLTWSE